MGLRKDSDMTLAIPHITTIQFVFFYSIFMTGFNAHLYCKLKDMRAKNERLTQKKCKLKASLTLCNYYLKKFYYEHGCTDLSVLKKIAHQIIVADQLTRIEKKKGL